MSAVVRYAPWAILAFALLATAGAIVDAASGGEYYGRVPLAFTVLGLVNAAVGAMIAARHPRNPIGWLFCVTGFAWAFAFCAGSYAVWAYRGHPGAFGGTAAAWFASWSWVLGVGPPIVGSLYLGADGRLASPRWRLPFAVTCAGLALVLVGAMAEPDLVFGPDEELSLPNPLASSAVAGLQAVGGPLVVGGLVAAAVSLVLRLRRARGRERDQLAWVASAFVVAALGATAGATLWSFVDWAVVPIVLGLVAIPVGVDIAILRHRLYDIDVVVRRTLVYGVVSAGLAGLYFGIVLALQQVFSSFAGGSDLAIAASTLAVAALFRPARSRVQALVNRRFYRRRYDAQRTLEAFATRLRDEIDLDALGAELQAAVRQTMQPTHVSLWLRPTEGTR